jgi:RHS repeat-associated protein
LSSTQLVTDGTGVAIQQVEYAPFGEVVNEYNIDWSSGQVPDFKFNAKELDEESGMYYFEARYQSPPVFISRDPLFEKYPTLSPYAYCANNPIKYIDPTGMEGEITDLVTADKDNKTKNTQELTKSLSKITGLNVGIVKRGNKSYLSYQKDKNGNPVVNHDANGKEIGSTIARKMLKTMIDNEKELHVSLAYSGSYAENDGVYLDFDRIKDFINGVQGGLNPETMGYGMSFLHELDHTSFGGNSNHDDVEKETFGIIGETVKKMNEIRLQLGSDYGQRLSYCSKSNKQGCSYFPFDNESLMELLWGVRPSILDKKKTKYVEVPTMGH